MLGCCLQGSTACMDSPAHEQASLPVAMQGQGPWRAASSTLIGGCAQPPGRHHGWQHHAAVQGQGLRFQLTQHAGASPSSAAVDLREHLLHLRVVPHCVSLLHAPGAQGSLTAAAIRLLSSLAGDRVFAAQLANNGEPQACICCLRTSSNGGIQIQIAYCYPFYERTNREQCQVE